VRPRLRTSATPRPTRPLSPAMPGPCSLRAVRFEDGTEWDRPTDTGSKRFTWQLGACRCMPADRANPPVPPNTSLLFGHNATALLPHRASIRRNIRLRSVDVHTPTGS
jgi:hypothetical protein